MLDEFIAANREEIIKRCRARVGARVLPPPTSAEIDEGVPQFLDQVASALRTGRTSSVEMDTSAARHGHSLLRQGFTVSQVVHDYGDICQSITELAIDKGAPVSTEDFRTLNLCLDDAIAAAVTQYGRAEHQALADSTMEGENRRLHFLTHELRNLVNTALLRSASSRGAMWAWLAARGPCSIGAWRGCVPSSIGRWPRSVSRRVSRTASAFSCPVSSKN